MALVSPSMIKRLRKNFKAFGLIFLSVMLGILVSEYVYDHVDGRAGSHTATEAAAEPNTQMRLEQVTKRN